MSGNKDANKSFGREESGITESPRLSRIHVMEILEKTDREDKTDRENNTKED